MAAPPLTIFFFWNKPFENYIFLKNLFLGGEFGFEAKALNKFTGRMEQHDDDTIRITRQDTIKKTLTSRLTVGSRVRVAHTQTLHHGDKKKLKKKKNEQTHTRNKRGAHNERAREHWLIETATANELSEPTNG